MAGGEVGAGAGVVSGGYIMGAGAKVVSGGVINYSLSFMLSFRTPS